MRRPAHALASVSVLIAAAVLTSGCQGKTATSSTGTPPPATTTAAATATPVAPTSAPVTLAQFTAALPAAPAGATAWAGRGGPSGGLTPKQYLTVEFGAADAAKLAAEEKQIGLAFGARRAWRQPKGVLVEVILGNYRNRTGAKTQYLNTESGLEQADAGDLDFTLPGAADSYGIADPRTDKAGNTEVDLLVQAGTALMHIVVKAPGTADQATAKAVALRVYANLCRLSDCAADSTS